MLLNSDVIIKKVHLQERHCLKLYAVGNPLMPHVFNRPYVRKSLQTHNFSKGWRQSSTVAHSYLEKDVEAYEKVGGYKTQTSQIPSR